MARLLALLVAALGLAVPACMPARRSFEEDLAAGYKELQQGDTQAAQARAEDAFRRAQAARDATWERRFKVLRAEILVEQLRDNDALALLVPMGQAGDPPDTSDVRALIARGFARCAVADAPEGFRQGEADLEDADRLAAGLRSAELAGWVTLRRGYCGLYNGDPEAADRLFREALSKGREAGSGFLEARSALSLGLLRVQTRRYDDATTWLDKAHSLGSALSAHRVVVRALTNLGWCYYTLGDYERALDYLGQAAKAAEARGYSGERMLSLQNIGNTHYRLRDLGKAADHYRRALVIARELGSKRVVGELVSNLGVVALEQGRYDEAEEHVREALRIKEENQDLAARQHSLQAEGQIWQGRGDYAKADELYREVLASPHSKGELLWETRASLASLRVETNQLAEADAEFRKALAVMDASQGGLNSTDHKISFFSSLGQFYDDYVDFLVSRGRPQQALELADRSRARQLRELLEVKASAPAATTARFQDTARALDAVILFYWLAPSRSFLWEVTSGSVRLHDLPGEAEIREQVSAHQGRVLQGRDPLAEGAPESVWLYRTLVGPVEARLKPGSRVVFVPDGALHLLNPETFVVPSPKPHYWIEDVTLTTAPSVSILAAGGRVAVSRDTTRRILLIGDPEPVGAEFPRLAHARGELERIAGEFPLAQRAVYAGSTAEPAVYRTSEPGRFAYIHFAAHAQANRQVPLESAVILSPGHESSKLYAREIVGVPLRAELVTLSACRGAGAREFAGEGLVGLTWAFLSSGAGNVIAGLWNVEDASTADLMTGLYGRVAKGERSAEALRQAKLELRRSDPAYAKPYYWAPFVTYTRGSARRP